MEKELLYTIEEVANYLKVHKVTVARYIEEGLLKAIRLTDRVVRIKATDLDEFIRRGE